MDLLNAYTNLLSDYGEPVNYWPQWCAAKKSIIEREKIIIGMILVQRTSWHNANITLKRLKENNLLSIDSIASLTELTHLTDLIRPAGFFQSKPTRLFDVCRYVKDAGGVEKLMQRDMDKLRSELLKIKGVGKETADTILLYAFDQPYFIIDEYTYRWSEAQGITVGRNYDLLQEYFHQHLEKDVTIYQKFHALIIISQRGKEISMMEIV